MRYQEAYDLIDIGITEAEISFPISPAIKEIFFDQSVEEVGLRNVRKRDMESFTASAKEYVFTNANVTEQIIKVELDGADVPFVDESTIISTSSDDDVSRIGFYLKTGVSSGSITTVTIASPSQITSTSHGLSTGDYVVFSEIRGVILSKVSPLNGKMFAVTKVDDDNFTVAVDTTSHSAHTSSTGVWNEDTKKIHLTKTPESGDTLKVYYYAKPQPKNNIRSRIDLPNQLIPAVIHRTLAHFLNISGKLQFGSGHNGLAEKLEADYIKVSRTREAMPHLVPNPMQVFTTTRSGSLGSLTGVDNG
jgi:hypothetical protein